MSFCTCNNNKEPECCDKCLLVIKISTQRVKLQRLSEKLIGVTYETMVDRTILKAKVAEHKLGLIVDVVDTYEEDVGRPAYEGKKFYINNIKLYYEPSLNGGIGALFDYSCDTVTYLSEEYLSDLCK